jgi:hypothetical protein
LSCGAAAGKLRDMNDYDKASRYLIKRDPAGFFRWLLRAAAVTFFCWIDARRLALPDQGDLTSDLVAAFRVGDGYEALCVELQAQSKSGTTARVLHGYVPRLRTEPAAASSLGLRAIGGAVVNLTGPAQPAGIWERPTLATACWLEGGIEQRTLRNEDAAATLALIESGQGSRWLLAWLPLMQGGADPGIIGRWRDEAGKEPTERDRATLGVLTLIFARLAGCEMEWRRGLEGWTVMKSEVLEELREMVRAQGEAEGRVAEARTWVLRLGRQRFGKAATRKQKAQLQAITDLARLERMGDRLFQAPSWDDLLSTP